MTVVLDRPYQFIPPHRGNWWPSFIQTFRLVDFYLKKKEGVVDYECRGLHHWEASLKRGDGILLAPNHCRTADPLALGWPARELKHHVHAVASWHLFNTGRFDSFAIQKMGGFSLNREGTDRASLEIAISILVDANRPLILFPEGTTNRTNDVLKPLLDGVAFIARTAARRRAKDSGGQVVMHPIALKYLCVGDTRDWCDQQLSELENRLGWARSTTFSILQRTTRLAEALLSLKEIQHIGTVQPGSLPSRRDHLIERVLDVSEIRLGVSRDADGIRGRVRAIRTEIVAQHFAAIKNGKEPLASRDRLARDVDASDLAQDLMSYPNCYMQPDQATDTRIVETIQRMQESFLGRSDIGVPLKVVIQCDEPILIPAEKAPRGERDPLMNRLQERLTIMLESLSAEARNAADAGLS
ncbi:1-acyl-sn-glycerol-3-phosphate acyltransferase [Rubripirellula reticaptiva]|uniref:Acyltransferase n=1 Tax=Rubripirellula reticaptiva TaxID=2528013 RepID=A0A5C6FAC5_9BACT|nr:1-acyl-sn-glycerol-3-phosphate acyltransferase [Rubripirellula reticaptiva]TWU57447.1 Acyltransferase [Rubripirellula reticaptiva]